MATETSNKYTIKILREIKYRNFNIVIRQIGWMFEYLVPIHKHIYAANIIVKPKLTRRFLPEPYTTKEFEASIKVIRKMAEATIDTVYYKDDRSMKELNATPKDAK